MRAEVLGIAASIGSERLWIEKVRVDTTPHELPAQVAAKSDAVADLQELLSRAEHDAEFMDSLRTDLQQLLGRVPTELLDMVPELHALRAGEIHDLVRRTAPSLVAHLAREG